MGSKNIGGLLLMGAFLFSSGLVAKADEVLQPIVSSTSISLTPPIPFRISPEEHLVETGDFHVGTSSAKPIVIVTSGTLSVGQDLSIGGSTGQPDIGSLTVQSGRVNAANVFIGSSGGQGEMVMKEATMSVTGNIHIGGKGDSFGGVGSLQVSGSSLVHAPKLFLGAGGTGSITVDGGEVHLDSIVFGDTPSSQGTITVNSGYLVTNSVTTAQIDQAIVLNGGAVATFGHDDADISGPGKLRIEEGGGTIYVDTRLNINSQIEGSGPLTIKGSGTITLSTNNIYSGITKVEIDTLAVSGTDTLSPNSSILMDFSSTLDINGDPQVIGALSGSAQSTVTNNGRIAATLTVGANNENGEYHGSIRDGKAYLSVHKVGSGTQIFTGSNGYTAGTIIHEGVLQVGNGDTTGVIIGNIKNSGTFVINRSDESTLQGTVEGNGTFIKDGAGNLILAEKNVYSGDTLIKSGTLTQGTENALSADSNISMANDTVLDLKGKNGRTGALSGARDSKVTNSGTSDATLSVGVNNSDGNFTGNIEDGPTSSVSLTKEGIGTQILAGTNTYSGKTTVSNGTLALGAVNAFSVNSDVVITANGNLDVRNYDSTIGSLSGAEGAKVTSTGTGKAMLNIGATDSSGIFHGIISNDPSSSLSINKVGTGTQVFTGDNTNTGTLVISSGAVQLGNGGTTGSIMSPEIQNNAALIIKRSNAFTITGTIYGTGDLIQIGTGTTILTADNDYTGNTIIKLGGMTIGNGGTTGSITSSKIENNGGLAFNRSDTMVYAGSIVGSGSVSQIGSGATILTGNNTYSGATIIKTGTLQLGNGGTSGAITTTSITNHGTLIYKRSDAVTFSGTISGTGALFQAGTGITTFTGNNTYTGVTTIASGTLQLGDGGVTGSIRSSTIRNDGAFVLNRSDAVIQSGTIYGTGDLIQIGIGTTILTADNYYTGETIIKSGRLTIGDGGTTGSITSSKIKNDGDLAFNRSDTMVYAGSIVGSGSVSQIGSGATILTGNNTYSGATIIKTGTLQLGNGGTTGSIQSAIIENNGTLGVDRADEMVLSGAVQGRGSLAQIGKGTTVLNGSNTYSGRTVIVRGTLAQGKANAFSANSDVEMKINTTLDLKARDSTIGSLSGAEGAKVTSTGTGKAMLNIGATNSDGIFHGIISNDPSSSLSINKVGIGTQVFTGDNTNTGNLVISSGALQLGNGGTTGSIISSKIQNNAALIINRSNAVTLTGTIQGTGSLAQIGTGTTILTANNTYTGGTTIDAGTLVGTTFSLQRNIYNHGRLVFAQSGAGTFFGTIFGSGGVIINSPRGKVTFNSDQMYTGPTVIQEGALSVNAQLQSRGVSIQKNGILSGRGTVHGDVENSGVMSRGDEPFALTVKGNYVQNPDGKFIIQLADANSYDRLQVDGNVRLDGDLEVKLAGKYIPSVGSEFNIITARGTGAIEGAFLNLYLPQEVTFEIRYDAKNVRLLVPTVGSATEIPSPTLTVSEKTRMKDIAFNTGKSVMNTALTSDNIFVGTDATLSGTGVFSGRFVNSGILSPGNDKSVGTMTLDGDYVQNPSGTLVIRIKDYESYDRFKISGAAELAGTLQVVLLNNFVPDDRSHFTILTADGGVTGTFSKLNFPPGAALKIAYGANEVRLYVSPTLVGYNPLQRVLAGAVNTTIIAAGASAAQEDAVGAGLSVDTESPAASPPEQGDGVGANPPAADTDSVAAASPPGQGDGVGASPPADANSVAAISRRIGKTYSGNLGVFIWLLSTLSPEEAASYLEQLAPLIAINIKDIIFNAANTQYGQLTARLAAMRAGVNGVSLNGISWEPMSAYLSKHEGKIVNKKKGRMPYFQEPDSRWDVFASASGVFSKINNPSDLPKINSVTGYFCAGADYRINDYVNTGIYVGYQGFKAWYSDGAWLRSNGVKFGLYGTARWEGFYLNTIVGGGANFVNMNRMINIKHRSWVARSYPFAGELNSLLGGGYELNLGPWRFGVNNSIQYTYLGISSFQEFGAGTLNVKGGSHNPSSLVYSLGGNIYYLWEIFPGYRVLPTIGLSWQHEFLNYGQKIAGTFANGQGAPFYFYTPTGARNNAFGTAGVTAQLGRSTGIYAYYSPQFGGGQIVSHGVVAGLTYYF